jgi:hypothetical protein
MKMIYYYILLLSVWVLTPIERLGPAQERYYRMIFISTYGGKK